MLTPCRSRTARRYESVATRRRPSPDAVRSTPVRIGRASSFDAAGTTWRSASARPAASTRTPTSGTSGSRGKSATANVRNVVENRPHSTNASSPVNSTVTVSPSSRWRMSANRRACTTALPSPSPWAGACTRIVSSRSEPTNSTPASVSVTRRPESTGRAPVRDATARWAVLTASARVSRSHRNFTVLLPGPYSLGSHSFAFLQPWVLRPWIRGLGVPQQDEDLYLVVVIGPVDCG